MLRRCIWPAMGSVFLGLLSAASAHASSFTCTPNVTSGFFACIAQPSAFYTSSTTLINIGGLTDGNTYSSISGGGLTVTFSTSMMRLTVPSSWGTWNCPPATEASCPQSPPLNPVNLPVLWSNGATSITMTLSSTESIFGFEAQPELSDTESITADFFDSSGTKVGSISRDVSGNGGALLFAASSNDPFKTVRLTDAGPRSGCPTGDVCDFAIANVRFSPTAIPEPASVLLLAAGLAGFAAPKLLRARR